MQVPDRQVLTAFWNRYPLPWNKNMSMNFMETYHITGLNAEKAICAMELSEADRSIYQL